MNTPFLIKCGYDAWQKQIVNINLKQNNLWKTGSIILNNKTHYYRLNPMMNTRLEMIKNENSYLLTVNGGIIYEQNKPFVYDTQLIVGGSHRKIQFSEDDYVLASIILYLDVINLFLFILDLLPGRNKD